MRLLLLALITGACGVLLVVGLAFGAIVAFQQPWFQMWFFSHMQGQRGQTPREPSSHPAAEYTRPEPDAELARTDADLFRATNVWSIHLRFTSAEFKALGPREVKPLQGWLLPNGAPVLHNPNAPRAGLAGVFGIEQPWSTGQVEFGKRVFTNVAIRFKGNGTFVESMDNYKRPMKLDFDEHVDGRRLAGQSTINLHNLAADSTFVSDSLGYEFYRQAGVPAPRTTYARVFLTIDGRWERRLLGVYALIENPDAAWAKAHFGSKDIALYKPVTLELFADLGEHWVDYDRVYHPKSTPSPAQRRRLIDVARFVTRADDAEFGRRVGEFFDLDATARFFACETLLSNLDGIYSNGQNFYLWHDPRSDRFGFSPWDLDHSWGEFPWVGSKEDRERADLFHPWVGDNRFLERLFAVPDFVSRYRAELTRLLDGPFSTSKLRPRIEELANAVRPAVAEESTARLERFERALGLSAEAASERTNSPPKKEGRGNRRDIHRIEEFIEARAEHARAQLNGTEKGVRLRRSR